MQCETVEVGEHAAAQQVNDILYCTVPVNGEAFFAWTKMMISVPAASSSQLAHASCRDQKARDDVKAKVLGDVAVLSIVDADHASFVHRSWRAALQQSFEAVIGIESSSYERQIDTLGCTCCW